MEWLVLVIIGFVAGTLGSLVGLGGGVFIVPAMLYLGSLTTTLPAITPQIAVGTSLLCIIFTGLSSTISYMKQGTVDYKSGFVFFIGSGPGAIAGAWTNQFLGMESFSLYFGIFIIFVAMILAIKDRIKPLSKDNMKGVIRTIQQEDGSVLTYGYQPALAILLTFFVGFTSGIFGIGGGSLMLPVMMLLFRFPAHIAIATSMFMIFLSSATSSITHIQLGNISWLIALALIPGAWFGGKMGAFLNKRLTGKTLVRVLRIILVVMGIRMILEGI